MDIEPLLKRLRAACLARDVTLLGIFGSVPRGENKTDSEVDLLVRLSKPVGFAEICSRRFFAATWISPAPRPLIAAIYERLEWRNSNRLRGR